MPTYRGKVNQCSQFIFASTLICAKVSVFATRQKFLIAPQRRVRGFDLNTVGFPGTLTLMPSVIIVEILCKKGSGIKSAVRIEITSASA